MGFDQATRYIKLLNNGFELLAGSPEARTTADEALPKLRYLAVKQHLLFYFVTANAIDIVRITHRRANIVEVITEN